MERVGLVLDGVAIAMVPFVSNKSNRWSVNFIFFFCDGFRIWCCCVEILRHGYVRAANFIIVTVGLRWGYYGRL